MSHGIVLDASAALKLVLAEEFSEHVEALFAATLGARQPVYGPPLLPAEILSALYQRARRRDPATAISFAEVEQSLRDFLALSVQIISPPELYVRTLAFAHTHGLARTYDAVYVVLAQLLGVELWTADQHLLNALGAAAPWVCWIGDYTLPPAGRASL
jgi:predicted nucleic acid-binding protein